MDVNAEPSALVVLELAEITQAIEMERAAKQTNWSSLIATPGEYYLQRSRMLLFCFGM